MVGRANHVAAMHVHHAFGLAGGTRGVEQEERIFRVHLLGGTISWKLEQIIEVDFAGSGELNPGPRVDHHLFYQFQVFESFIDDAFEGHGLAAPEADVPHNHHLGLRVGNAVAQSGVAQAGIHDRMNRANTCASQHGNRAFDRQGHINDHAVALHHAQRLQTVGEAADLAVKLSIGNDALAAIFTQPNEGGAIAPFRVGMPVQRINGDVGLGAGEPLVVYAVPLQHAVPLPGPLEAGCIVRPEAFRIFPRAGTFSQPVFLNGIADHNLRRCIFLIHGQQVGNVFGLRDGESVHADLRGVREMLADWRGFSSGDESSAVTQITAWCVLTTERGHPYKSWLTSGARMT